MVVHERPFVAMEVCGRFRLGSTLRYHTTLNLKKQELKSCRIKMDLIKTMHTVATFCNGSRVDD